MSSPSIQNGFPAWLIILSCLFPQVGLLIICIGCVMGADISPLVILTLVCLAWRVTAHVIGAKAMPLSEALPQLVSAYKALRSPRGAAKGDE